MAWWFVYLAASPFYVIQSGLPQPADVFMAVIILTILTGYFVRIPLHRDLYLVAATFLALVAIVNWFWYTQYPHLKFLLSSVFYLYNFAVVVAVLTLAKEFGSSFLAATRAGLIASVLVELVFILFLPELRGIRATGTFNNPNQLGYWTLLTGACWLSLKSSPASGSPDARLSAFDVGLLFAVGYMAAHSLSKAAMVSFLALFGIGLCFQGTGIRMKVAIALALAAGVTSLVVSSDLAETLLTEGLTAQVVDRFEGIGEQEDDSLEARGYDRIWKYPEYLLYGAGEGAYQRFLHDVEMHSTFGTVLFSYGIGGLALFLGLLWMIFRRAELRHLAYFLPACLYGITHQGLRFTLLWVFLGLVFARAVYYEPRIRQRGHAVFFDPSRNRQVVPGQNPHPHGGHARAARDAAIERTP
jgi:hypothetical protein